MKLRGNAGMNKNFWRGKKIFLTGHTGFKGSWLSAWLQNLGAHVKGYSLESKVDSLFSQVSLFKDMDSFIGDVRNLDLLKNQMKAFDPEIVIHMAAQPLVRYSYQNPVETFSTNVMGTVHVLEAARACKNLRALINVTTDKVYKNKEWIWPYRESDRLGGHDPYSNSKACSELVTESYRSSFFKDVAIATARAGNVIGGGDWTEDRLIPDFFRSHIRNEPLFIRNPKSIRPWQHVLDALRGYLLLAESLHSKGAEFAQAWNFGPPDENYLTVEEVIAYLAKGYEVKINFEPSPEYHEAKILKLDWTKAKTFLKWQPVFNIEKTLDDVKSFYLETLTRPKDLSSFLQQSINHYEKTCTKN